MKVNKVQLEILLGRKFGVLYDRICYSNVHGKQVSRAVFGIAALRSLTRSYKKMCEEYLNNLNSY